MVRLPIGTKVIVDLWNRGKNQGMVKHYGTTMDLIVAESEFDLKNGDRAIVADSTDMHIIIIPEDEYSALLSGTRLNKLDINGLASKIGKLLKKHEQISGGILQVAEILDLLKNTSIKRILNEKHIVKASNSKNSIFSQVKDNEISYLVLRPSNNSHDFHTILNYSRNHPFITKEMIHKKFRWTSLRMERIFNYLMKISKCRIDNSYKNGVRFYFLNK